jgi:cation diffusion facilitator family transporter
MLPARMACRLALFVLLSLDPFNFFPSRYTFLMSEKHDVARTSAIASGILTAFKLGVGILTGSLALISEGIHSLLDFLVTLATWASVRAADVPADKTHHYGHGKIENLSAFTEAILLLATAAFICKESITRLLAAHSPDVGQLWWGIVVIIVSIIVDISRSIALTRAAKKFKSQALEADALHFTTELVSSLAVLVSLILIKLDSVHFRWADPTAAILVALIMFLTAFRLGKRAADMLIDRAPEGLESQLQATIRRVPGVCDVPRVRARTSGANTFVDATITVDPTIPIAAGHQIADTVELAVTESHPDIDLVVHVEPAESVGDEVNSIRDLASGMNLHVHAIRVRIVHNQRYINFHVELAPDMTVSDAHSLISQLEDRIRRRLPQVAEIDSHLEPDGHHA